MNHGISILFRTIPLAMAAFCFAYGAYIFAAGTDAARLTAGPVVFYLGSICIALYCTAATIIRQIIGTYTAAAKYLFPAIGYTFAMLTLISGAFIIASHWPGALVTGHVVCGLGLITACVATAATSSTRFSLIPKNSADDSFSVNPAGFTRAESSLLIFIVSAIAAIAWVWCILLYVRGTLPAHIVAGSVMFGIACVCTSLIALVASIARQARGSYTMAEKGKWTGLVLTMGSLAFVLGLILIFAYWDHPINFMGFVLIGLALICWSISSKVILLAKIWHADFPLANRIPIIPVLTALACLFLAAFLYEEAHSRPNSSSRRVCCRDSAPSVSRSTPSSRSSKAERRKNKRTKDFIRFWRRRFVLKRSGARMGSIGIRPIRALRAQVRRCPIKSE